MISGKTRGVETVDVERVREQIPGCRSAIYMNTGWSGPSPKGVVEAMKDRLEYESYEGPTSPPVYESGRVIQQEARAAVASLLNVSSHEVILTQCTTDGLNMALNGLSWSEGDEVITFGLEHSSVLVPAYRLQERGVRVKALPLQPGDSGEDILARVEEAITPRSRLLFFSHIEYTCGLRMPIEDLRALTKAHGVLMLVDGAQTAGHVALDLRALDVDFYSIPGQKWLLGPDGVGAFYVREDLISSLNPVRVSGHAAVSYDDRGGYESNANSINKFLLTTSSAPLALGLTRAVGFYRELGAEAVERRALALSKLLKKSLSEIPGVTLMSPTEDRRSCGLTSFRIRGVDSNDAVARLWDDHRIVVRYVRELSCVRAATHAFNTEDEVGRLAAAVRGLAQ